MTLLREDSIRDWRPVVALILAAGCFADFSGCSSSGARSGGDASDGVGGSGSGGSTQSPSDGGVVGSGGNNVGPDDSGVRGTGGGAVTGSGGSGVGGGGAVGGTTAVGSGGAGGSGAGIAGSASWFPQDIPFTSTTNKANPYSNVTDFKVTFSGPGGVKVVLPGFYIGGQVWKVRFAPTAAGTFTYVTSSAQDASLNGLTGTVTPSTNNPNGHGAMKVDRANPHHYLFEDGTRPFQMGYEIDWLGMMDFGDMNIPKAKSIIDMIAANGFSEVIMNAYAYDTSWKSGTTSAFDFGPPALIAWGGGTNAAPDYTTMREAYWQSFDRVVAYLFQKGITAHMFFRVYNKGVNWPANGSAGDDLYFKYIVARYQAYSNIVWDFSKETYNEKDQNYIASRLNLIKANDGYQRLRTLHDPDGGQSQLSPNYYDIAAHAGTFDFYTDQSSNQYSTAKGALAKRAIPYYNAEVTLYQVGNDGTFTYGPHSPKEAVFAASMEVVMAGGYVAYYYSLQAWDVVRWNETPTGIASYRNLSAFMKGTGWYKLTASDSLVGGGAVGTHCLADPGKEYILYKSGAGSVTLNVAGAATALSAVWTNLVSNAQTPLTDQTNGSHAFTNPWSDPAVLHLMAR